jgi:hypothetical protein
MAVIGNPHASRNIISEICDTLKSGAPLTPHLQRRSLAALRDIREREGDAAARDAAARLRTVALSQAAVLVGKPAGGGGASPSGPRGATAAELRAMHQRWLQSHRSLA